MEMGGASSESEVLKIGLKFGEEIYFEDVGVGGETKSEGGLSPVAGGGGGDGGGGGGGPQKKGRTGGGGGQMGLGLGQQQPPRCQVEGCNLDLSEAKTYYSRHKVCGVHSKTAKVIVNGLEQRFCQQCSRFHQLPEFDQGKRSCRRRLAGHNERRRKPTSGSLLSARYGSLPSSLFESNGNGGSFLMDFSSCSRAPPRAATGVDWSTTRAPPPRAANDLPITTEKYPPLPWQSNLDNPPPYINPNVPPGLGCLNGSVQDSNNCALSLLSNHSTTGSTNQTLSLEYSWFNPDATNGNAPPMVQPPNGTMVLGHYSTTAWGYDTNEAHSHLGLGQIPQSGYNSGELGLGQQGGRRYDSSADHIDWSL